MSSTIPDDDIADTVEVSTAAQLRAYAGPRRMTLLALSRRTALTPNPRSQCWERGMLVLPISSRG